MKFIFGILAVLTPLVSSSVMYAQSDLAYDEIKKFIPMLRDVQIEDVSHVPFYIAPKQEIDWQTANFRLVSLGGEELVIRWEFLSDIPIDKLEHDDIDQIEEGFKVRIWIPNDVQKYSGWILRNDLPKGSLKLAFKKVLSSEDIEKKRQEIARKQNAEQGTAPNP